jgi:hypothetical protein
LLFLAYAEYFPVVHHEMFLSCQGVVRPATDVPHTRHGVITGPPFCFTGGPKWEEAEVRLTEQVLGERGGKNDVSYFSYLLDQAVHE